MASSKKILLLSAICLLTVLLYPLGVSAQQGDSVRIHSIVVKPVEGQLYYRVEGFASVLDSNRSPILDIKNDLFQFMEDGNPVQVDQITVAPHSIEHCGCIGHKWKHGRFGNAAIQRSCW